MSHILQLKEILRASGWSQEQLARELAVSFPTLNAWINERSRPRKKALENIETLYLTIVGLADTVDFVTLQQAKKDAAQLTISPKALAENKHALDKLTLYLTYHTNIIEGSTMTLSDVEDVIFNQKVLANRTAIEQAEARNHQAAFYWLFDKLIQRGKRFVIDEEIIIGLHLRLMNGILTDAGQYRRHAVRIMGSHVVVANSLKVPSLMQEFITACQTPSKDSIELLAKTHAAFEQIHPFSDGNGRVGRLLLLTQALQAGLTPPLVAKERKYAYYKYLERAQTKDDYKPLELFIAQSMEFCHKLLV